MNPKDKHADWLLKPTANELADIQAFKTEELTIWERNTTATMLRQQQAEIDRLKALCISYIDDEWSGTSSYQAKIDEVNNERK